MSADQTRVAEARQRLRTADHNPFRHDPAIRIVELDAPRPGWEPLVFHPRLVILAGLSSTAHQSIAATVDAIRLRNADVGLTGRVESFGRRRPLSSLPALVQRPGAAVELTHLFVGNPEASIYVEVAESAERAIRLSSSELRGADSRGEEIDEQRQQMADQLAAATAVVPSHNERSAMLATIDDVVLPVEVTEKLRDQLGQLRADPQRVELQAAVVQAEAAKARVLPGDGNQAALLADLAIAEADGSLAAYDVTPGGPASEIHGHLAQLGLAGAPDQAPQIAERLLAETIELRAMRQKISRELGQGSEPAPVDDDDSLIDLRRQVDEQRLHIQRRLRAQQQLLAIAQATIAELNGAADFDRAVGDYSPLLIEDPLMDLPARLNGAVLSMLLRHSVHRQVICVSNQRVLEAWSRSVAGRAGWVEAHGWFSARR